VGQPRVETSATYPSAHHPESSRGVSLPANRIETHTSISSRKLEHTPLHSLLAMAKDVPIGHGKYLREAFEKGHVDKDGLVKVLKARAKGRDFTREYRQQASRHKQKRLSPEFLSHPAANNQPDASSEYNDNNSITDEITTSSSVAPKQPALAKIPLSSEVMSTRENPLQTSEETYRRYWILIGIVGIGVVIWVITALIK
jgi:hypothetical protein